MLTRSKVILLIFGFICAGIITAQNYGTAYAYSTEDIADFNATTVSYYQNLTITAIVPPMYFGNIGIKSTPENQAGQRVQIHLLVNYALNKDGYSTEDLTQPPNHQALSYIQAMNLRNLMSNQSVDVYGQQNFANGSNFRVPFDVSETGTERISGIKYTGLVMSAEQAAVCFCEINGFTYENVTESDTVVVLGAGGVRPVVVISEESLPVPTDFDVSDGRIDPYNTTPPMFMGMSTASTQETPENAVNMPLQFTPTYDIPADLQANKTGMHTELTGLEEFLIFVILFICTMLIIEWTGLWDWMRIQAKAYKEGYWAGFADGCKAQANADNASIWEAYYNGTISLQVALYLMGKIFGNLDNNLISIPDPPNNPYDEPFNIWNIIMAIIEFLMPVIIVVVVAFIAWALICRLISSSKQKLSESLKSEKTSGREITIKANAINTEAMGGVLAVV
jgi:hypothetical protein